MPTDTPTATPTPIPGWEKFEGGGAELWLPESYEGGDPSQDVEIIVEAMRRLGPDFEQAAQMLEQNPSAFALWAFDSEISESGFLTNVNVVKERVLLAMTIGTYLDAAASQLPSPWRVVEQEIVSLDRYEAGRLVMEVTYAGVSAKQLIYAIKDNNTMWVITFSTSASEYDLRLPTFEQSIRTFVIQ